jgi:UDP-glucose 4-epimerase
VEDLVAAMLFIADHGPDRLNILNIGPPDDGVTVRFIAEAVRDTVEAGAAIAYGDGDRGWVGDVPRFRYSVDQLAELGWRPSMDSAAAVRRAIREIADQEGRA